MKTHAAYSKETNIFRYGYPNLNEGRPRVTYFNDTDDVNKSDKCIVYLNYYANTDGILLDIPSQSWNLLTITYNEGIADVFVNGNLEKTVKLDSDKQPQYHTSDIFEVGSGDNTHLNGGLHGAICNVVYHKIPLTQFKIAADYNLNRYNNPPIN